MYERVGTYAGNVPIQDLADRLRSFDIAWADTYGYGTTTDHLVAVRDAFRPDLIEALPGEWAYSMLVILKPGMGSIRFHRDLKQREGLVRHHLVLQTNEHCWNFHDGIWQQLELGVIYTLDETKEHASINGGESPRVHLVVDIAQVAEFAREAVMAH